MKRANILTGMVAAGAMVLMMAAQVTAATDGATPTAKTVKLFAVGNGTGSDDKSGPGCPDLVCSVNDFCACLSGSAPHFSGAGICKASLTNMEVNFDFIGPTVTDLRGIQNGTNTDLTDSGRCYGASGFATITRANTNSDTINLLLQGVVCDAIPTPTTTNQASFNGTYIINGGTGPYAAATGTGSFTASLDDVNMFPTLTPMTFSATGSITALFSEDRSCRQGQ